MNTNLAYQEEPREELIGGEVVFMSPRPNRNHNIVAGNIFGIFWRYLDGRPCTPIADGMHLFLSERNRFVPDFMIVCEEEKLKWDGVHGAPDLVAEVLSPSTARQDRTIKMQAYEQAGVQEYWIVSAAEKQVEQYLLRDGRFVLREIYSYLPEYVLRTMSETERTSYVSTFHCSLYDDLEISLADIFQRTL